MLYSYMVATKTTIKSLKPGRYCVIEGEPCKVLSVTTSAPGKHGGAKARLEAVGIFDNKRRSVVKPASTEIDVPLVDKRVGQVLSISGNIAQLMDMETYETLELDMPKDEELAKKVKEGADIVFWEVMGIKQIK